MSDRHLGPSSRLGQLWATYVELLMRFKAFRFAATILERVTR